MPSPPRRSRGHELSRTRRTRAVPQETGRLHHLGGPPPAAPVLGADGSAGWTDVSPYRVRELPAPVLSTLAEELRTAMAAAGTVLDFEEAAALRDRLAVVTAEQERRAGPVQDPA